MPGFRAFGQTRCQKKDGRCFLTRRKARGTGRWCIDGGGKPAGFSLRPSLSALPPCSSNSSTAMSRPLRSRCYFAG